MNSIKIKLIAIYSAVILVVLIVSGTVILLDIRRMEVGRAEGQLADRARHINTEVVQQYDRDRFIDAGVWAILIQSEYDIESMIMNDVGLPIAPAAFIHLRPTSQALTSAVAGEARFSSGDSGVDVRGINQQWISFAMPVTHGDETFIIYTRVSTRFMNESLASTAFTLVLVVGIALLLTLFLWFFLANTLTSPIVALTRHAKDIAAGDFSREIAVKSNDELGQLAFNFNHMARELSSTLNNMESERNKREAILQNTSHGVLAYSKEGELIHANNASLELLSEIDLQHARFNDVLAFLGLETSDVYNLKSDDSIESTYQDGDYFVHAYVTSYSSQPNKIDGFVIVLQDISRQAKLDNMRKEFVANVSHELRTPLTSIRTYTETLLNGAAEDPQMAENFLKVIDEEANRMTLLVSDLLELSRIDSKQSALEMDMVDLVGLLRLTVRQSQFMATQKSQTIALDISDTPCFVEANASRINQVITNIISNSIKYSPENTTITVTMETTEKYFRIFIKDQGMGIPPESLGRVFERFYRVDKARARAMGGTGLGLAIVKEIMEEHDGRVHVTSTMGQGTTMVLRFNKYSMDDMGADDV